MQMQVWMLCGISVPASGESRQMRWALLALLYVGAAIQQVRKSNYNFHHDINIKSKIFVSNKFDFLCSLRQL